MDFKELGKHVAKLRKEQSLAQNTVANDIGISRVTLSSFENGRDVDIGCRKILQILDYLGYEISIKQKIQFPTFEELKNASS